MGTPSDRLDDAYLARKQEEEAADLLEWLEQRGAPATPEAPDAAAPAPPAAEAPSPEAERPMIPPIPGRMGRLLHEGGEAAIRGTERLIEASPIGVARRALAGEPPRSPLAETAQAGMGALELLGAAGTAAGVLMGQGAVEEALVQAGVPEARARSAAELIVSVGVPVAASRIPVIAKALAGGSLSKRVVRELIGTPEPMTPRTDVPDLRAPVPEALSEGHAAIQALAKEWESIRDTARRGTRTREQAMTEATASPMSLDEVRALFPGLAMNDTQAVRLINTLVDLAENGQAMARAALDSGDEGQIDEALRAFALLMDADPKRSGVVAESGRTLSVMNDPVSGMNQYLDAIVETLVDGAGLPKAALLKRLAAVKSKEAYATLAKQLAQPTWNDAFTELWINGLLSGPPTHVVNALSNTLTTAWGIGTRITASAIGVTHGGLQPGEAYHALWGLMQGTKDGWRLAATALREGAPASKLDQPVKRAIRGETFGLTGDTGRAIDYLGEVVRAPTRFLMSADEFFKAVNFRMELHAQAYRLAAEEGLTGKAAAARMADILANPPPSVKAAADRFALHQTFQTELTGRFTTGVQQAFSGPVGKLFLPFIKTPTNIFKYSLENTPLAPFLKSWRADVMAGGARRDLALAKVTLGTSTMYLVTQYAADGRITGGGPKGPERDEWLDTHQPYSIKIGGKWVSYNRLDPVGMLIGFAADYAELSGELDERTGGEFALALTAALAKNLSSKTYVKGIADLIEALENPGSKVENVIGRLSRSLVPRAVAGLERVADPELRDPTPSPETKALFRTLERIYNEACSQTIGCSKSLPPRRNLFGDPIRLGYGEAWEWVNPIYVRDVNEDPVSQELVRLRVRLSMPPRTIAAGMEGAKPIPLTPQEYDQFVQLAAGKPVTTEDGRTLRVADLDGRPLPTLRERLASLIQTAEYRRQTDGPDGGKARAVRTVVETYRDAALLVMQGTPALKATITKRLQARGAELTPGAAPAVGVRP